MKEWVNCSDIGEAKIKIVELASRKEYFISIISVTSDKNWPWTSLAKKKKKKRKRKERKSRGGGDGYFFHKKIKVRDVYIS